ncbi:MAG: sigma-70 family RNA polymerase sigma factor [Ruminococcus sp.]|nr:sigma-70 family RNA polymerase sigma factor [Ruminococcus sp.]
MNKQPKFKIDNAKLTRLVAKAQGGNQKALDEVVNMVSGYIYYYCLTLLGDEEKSKDAVQDILLTMLKKLDSLADSKAFLGWIKTITSNYCKTKLTRSKDNLSLDEDTWDFADENEQICPSKSAETSEVCGYIREAVKALPQLLRESVMMFYFNQMSVKEIAETLEVNENTVKSRLHSARKTMKKHLEQYGGAALASCAVPPMSLVSFSLIEGAETQKNILIPYATQSGTVKLASINPVKAAGSFPLKAAAIGAACAVVIGAAGAAAASGSFGGKSPEQAPKPTEKVFSVQQTTAQAKTEAPTNAYATAPVAVNNGNSDNKSESKGTEPAQNQEYTRAQSTPQSSAVQNTEPATTAVTEATESDEKITATFNIKVDKQTFYDTEKFFCKIYDETGGYVVIKRGILKQSGSSDTWRFSFDEQIQKVVMYSGRKYSITFIDNCGIATEPLTIESFDTAKAYTAVYTGKKAYDMVTRTTNSVYKWT